MISLNLFNCKILMNRREICPWTHFDQFSHFVITVIIQHFRFRFFFSFGFFSSVEIRRFSSLVSSFENPFFQMTSSSSSSCSCSWCNQSLLNSIRSSNTCSHFICSSCHIRSDISPSICPWCCYESAKEFIETNQICSGRFSFRF